MSDKPNNGGPAFPNPNDCKLGEEGMTLRDYFAAKALVGMLAYSHVNPSRGNYHENCDFAGVAKDAFSYADAMLRERK